MSKRERIYFRVSKGEEWKTPSGFPEWVLVSKSGEVFLLEHDVQRGDFFMTLKEKPLKQKDDGFGYRIVQFRINGKNKGHRVHRLVMLAHGNSLGDGMDVNHKNGIKHDNRLENLEWSTRSENIQHSYSVLGRVGAWKGKEARNAGEKNHPSLSKKIIGTPVSGGPDISFPSTREAGRSGFSRDGIAHCLCGTQKTANGYVWRFA